MIVEEERYLAHYGVPGMKWGKRKQQKNQQTEKRAKELMGNNKYRYNKNNYGMKRINRMVKSMDEKGLSYNQALNKEQIRLARVRTAKVLAFFGGVTLFYADAASGGDIHKSVINAGKQVVNKLEKTMFKTVILDSSGNVIKRFRK